MMKEETMDKATDSALNQHYDVGVVGVWDGRNYGSLITYYALHHVLRQMGMSVLMIQSPHVVKKRPGTIRSHAEMVSDEFYHVSEQYSPETLPQVNALCDAFLVGSDQVWHTLLSRVHGLTYYLDFVAEDKKKISYATSAGGAFLGTEEERVVFSQLIGRFDHVSVRDDMGIQICKDSFGVEAVKTCDPTLLCEVEVYRALAKKSTRHQEGPYILAFILNPCPEFGVMLEKLARESGKKVVVVLDELPMTWAENKEKLQLSPQTQLEVKELVNLYQWLWYYEHCDAVVTDSFHGSIFSMIFQKPFLTRINRPRGGERFTALFQDIGISSRLYEEPAEMDLSLLEQMDFAPVNEKIAKAKAFSLGWLKEAVLGGERD